MQRQLLLQVISAVSFIIIISYIHFLTSFCPISGVATTVTVSSASATPLTSLTGVSTVPIGMLHQQLLVQSGTGGVRQLLFPLNFSSSRGGASTPRYIQVRQVTMSGQPGVLSFPARFGAPITMRAVAHTAVNVTQPGQQQIQQAQEQAATAVKPSVAGDTHVILSSEIPVATQVRTYFHFVLEMLFRANLNACFPLN